MTDPVAMEIREYRPEDFMLINVTTQNKWTQFPKTTNRQNSSERNHLGDSRTIKEVELVIKNLLKQTCPELK